MQILGSYLVSRTGRKQWSRLLQSHETIAAHFVKKCVQMQKKRRLEALECLSSYFQRRSSVHEYSKIVEQSNMTLRHNSYERIAQTVVVHCDRRKFLTLRVSTILLQACLRRSLEYALLYFHLLSTQNSPGNEEIETMQPLQEHKETPQGVSDDECSAIQNEHEDQIEGLEPENNLPLYQTQQLKSVTVFSLTAQELKDDDFAILARERERISRRMTRSQGNVEHLFPHELACGSPIASRLALRHLMTSKK